jgi:lactate dehydrogenase-like 2-hydroxyacid dehydrogenase
MPKRKLLQIGKITPRMTDRLQADFDIVEYFKFENKDRLVADNQDEIVCILTDGHWGVPDNLMDRLPNLEIISSYGVGYDAIDANFAASKNIVVTNTPEVLNDEVADTAIMLWLAVFRQLIQADKWARQGTWEKEGSFPLSRSVQNQKIGILGLGRIGETIAKRAKAFEAEIHYHSRSKKNNDYHYHVSPKELAENVDVLFVITPGGNATKHLVDLGVLKALGKSGTLINVSRGSVVDEKALIEALQTGTLGSAGLDVFEAEPFIPDELKNMKNVVLTPHIGSATTQTRQAMGDLTCDNLLSYFKSGRVFTPVPECSNLNV